MGHIWGKLDMKGSTAGGEMFELPEQGERWKLKTNILSALEKETQKTHKGQMTPDQANGMFVTSPPQQKTKKSHHNENTGGSKITAGFSACE